MEAASLANRFLPTFWGLFGRYAIVSAKLIAHFVKQFLGRRNAAEERVYRLQRSLVHPLVERGVTVAWEGHLIVPKETRPRGGFAAHIRRRADDDDSFDVVVAQNGVEACLKERVILMLYDATLFGPQHLVIKLLGCPFQTYLSSRIAGNFNGKTSEISVLYLRDTLLSDRLVIIAYWYRRVPPRLGHRCDLCHVNQPLPFLGATLFGEPHHISISQHGLETPANNLARCKLDRHSGAVGES
jgi:hypothetical protein